MAEQERNTLRELIRVLVRRLGILEKSDARSSSFSLAQCHAIVEIGRKGKINLNDLANLLGVDKSTMSRTINNLVESGLAVRALDDDDRRYVVIQLTECGQLLFEDTETSMHQYFSNVFQRIPENKREQVLESLALLVDAVSEGVCGQT